MEESDNADISGISGTTNTEQKNEEEKDESNTKNKETVVTESDDSQKKETKVEDGTESDKSEETDEAEPGINAAEFGAIETVEPVPIIPMYCEVGEDGNLVELDEPNVAIHFTDGVDGDMAVGGDRPVKFRVEALDGWKDEANTDIKVAWGIEEDGKELEISADKTAADEYTIATNRTTDDKEKKKYYSGPITIRVTAERIQPKLIASTADTVWLNDEDKTPITTAGVAKEFSLFQEEISVVVDAKAVDDVQVAVKIGASDALTAVDCVRTDDAVAVTDGEEAPKYPVYTFDPTALEGYAANTRNSGLSFVITKTTNAEKSLTLAIDANKGAAYTVKAVGAGAELADTEDTHYLKVLGDDALPSVSLDKTNYAKTEEKNNVLAFEVQAGDNREVKENGVKAVLTKSGDTAFSKDIEATAETYTTGEGEEAVEHTYYLIALSGIEEDDFDKDLILTIQAETAYKDAETEFPVHNIEFTGDTANVEIKENASGTTVTTANFDDQDDMSTSFSTNEDALYFAIKAKDGYTIANGKKFDGVATNETPVVTVSYDKVYHLTKGEAATLETIPVTVSEEDEELTLTPVSSGAEIYKLSSGFVLGDEASGDDGWSEAVTDEEEAAGYNEWNEGGSTYGDAPYSLKNIKIKIETETETNQAGKITVDVRDEGLSYDVVTGSGVEATETENEYTISEEASFVTLNITSASGAPLVSYEKAPSGSESAAVVAGAEGSYSVTIPVKKLQGAVMGAGSTNSNIDSTITISKNAKSFSVKLDSNAGSNFDGRIKVNKGDEKDYASADSTDLTHKQGDTVSVVLYAKDGTEFKSVKTETGTGDSMQEAEIALGENKSEVAFELKMTDNVVVVVKTNDIYTASLSYKQGATIVSDVQPVDGIYEIPVGSKDITATLLNGSSPANITYAKLYDGDAVAASKVAVSTNTAKIAAIDEKDTGMLRLELTAKVNGKMQPVATLQIRQEKMAEKMAIIDPWDGSAQSSVTLEPDSEGVTYKVMAEEGSLAFSNNTILLELTEDEAKPGKKATWDAMSGKYTVTDAKNNVTAVYDTNDRTLTVKALPSVQGGYKGVLRFYDDAKRKDKKIQDNICAVAGGTIAVETTAPSLNDATLTVTGLNHTNTHLKLQVESNAKQPTGDSGNRVFYRVSFPTSDTFGASNLKGDKYFLKSGDSQVLDIRVNPDSDPKSKTGEPYSDPKTFHPTVSLVQTTKGLATAETESGYNVANLTKSSLITKDAEAIEAATKEARYEHTLALTPAKATVYTGAETAQVTKAVFSDNTGFAHITKLEFVDTKTGVIRGSWQAGYGTSTYSNLVATRNTKDGTVSINAEYAAYNKNYPDTFKNLGLKVTATAGDGTNAMPASKVLPLTVVAGVGSIAFENGYQQSIYKQPGKAASLKVKAVLNDGKKELAPKKKKFVYTMGDANGRLPGDALYTKPSFAVTSGVTVNAKNGTVKVDKNFTVDTKNPENNKFSVVAMETYSGQSKAVCITINDVAQSVGRIVIVDNTGAVVAENGVLKADDFYTKEGNNRPLYVRALTNTAEKTNGKYGTVSTDEGQWDASSNYIPGVKYTSGAKNALAVDSTSGRLTFLKGQSKPVKLSVAAADGSKSKAQSIEVTVQGYSAIALSISGQGATSAVNNSADITAQNVNYDGAMAAGFILIPKVKVNGQWIGVPSDYFKNLNIKIGKAKKISLPKNYIYWQIVKTDVASTVTVTDKTNKAVTASYTISQNPPATVKGPKIKSLTKLTQQMLDAARYAEDPAQGIIPVRFRINAKDLSAYAGQYMMITPDYTKTKVLSKQIQWKECDRASSIFLNKENAYTSKGYELVKIDANGVFEIPLNMYGKTNESVVPGNYTLIATVGSYDGGNFKPVAKGTSVKIKIPGKAPKALSLKLNGNFTLDESGSAVDIASGITSGRDWYLANTPVEGNYAMNKIDPATGKPNAFRKYFTVAYSDGAYRLSLQSGLTLAEIEGLRENSVDCEGYITVATADQRQDMLIKVTIGDSVMSAVANDSYVGAETTVKFYANAKSKTPIKLKGVVLDASSEGSPSFATGTAINNLHVVKEGEDSVKIKLGAAEAGKSYKVAFKVLAADSAYANATGKGVTVNEAYVASHGRLVTATFKVVDPAKTKNAVTIEAEDAANGLAFTAYSEANYDAKKKTYCLNVVTKSAIDGADVSEAKIAETVKNKPYEGTGIVDIKKNKKDNCFILTLDKTAFVDKADSKTAGNFKRGKSVDIPVELTFANNNIASQTVNVKVALPDPMDIDRAVAAANKAMAEMAAFRVINMTNMMNEENNGEDPRVTLQKWVNDAWNRAIPYDTEAAEITRNISLGNKTTTGDNPVTTWEAVLSIKADKKENPPKWTQTLVYTPEEKLVQADTLADAIGDLTFTVNADGYLVNKGNKVDNDYTADKLKEDIVKMLAGTKIPSNLNILVEGFQIKKATVKADGKVTATIKVYNAVTKQTTVANSVSFTFGKLGDLGGNADRIKEAIKDKSAGGKVDYQKVIYDTLKDATGLTDVEDALAAAIKEAAEASRTNTSVTVDFDPIKITAGNVGDFDNPNIAADDEISVGFVLPDASNDGTVKFKLIVSQPGMKDYTIDKTAGISVAKADADSKLIFQTVSDAKTDSANWHSGTDAILTDSYTAGTTPLASFKEIDSDDDSEIIERIEAAVRTKLTGIGLVVEATKEEGFKQNADGTGNGTHDAETDVYAKGTVTISDNLERDDAWAFNYIVKIPAKAAEVKGVDVTATRTTDAGTSEDLPITGNAVRITEIGEKEVIAFTAKAVGNWLTDAQKSKFKYTLQDENGDALANNKTTDGGVVLGADGKLTVDPSKVTDGKDSTTGLTVKVLIAHNEKLNNTDDLESLDAARKATITVALKFKDATSAALKLKEQTSGAYKWMPAAGPITATVDAKSDGSGYEIKAENQTTLTSAIKNAAEAYLTKIGYTGYTVAVKDDAYTVTASDAKFTLTVTKGEDSDDTDELTIDAVKSPKTVANELMKALKAAAATLNSNAGLKDTGDVAAYDAAAAKTLIESELSETLNGATVTVSTVTAGSGKVTVAFTVTPAGTDSVASDSDTLDITIDAAP